MSLAATVILLVILVVGGYLYMDNKLQGIPRQHVSALTAEQSGQPIDILLVGSDSRSFVKTSGQAQAFGSASTQTGQRADTIMVVRLLSGGRVEMLSIPRDTWVPIAGANGSSKINASFNTGPNQLVQTIQANFHIPINHVVLANFLGFSGMVDSLGGIYLNFPDPVRDSYTGLNVTRTGCQLVTGPQALALVRSRHLYYYSHGAWNYDGMSDFSRIKRQQAFFHALLSRAHSVIPDVFRLNSFVGAAVSDIGVDSVLSSNELMAIGWDYHSLGQQNLVTSVLPTTPSVIGGQDVLLPVKSNDQQVINAFLAGNTGAFTSALGQGARSAAHLTSASVVSNNLVEPWNPVPC